MKIHTLVVGRLQTNCYILQSGHEAIVIDPGDESDRIIKFLATLNVRTKQIVATHAHFDHVLGVDGVRQATNTSFLIHEDDLGILQSMQERVKLLMGLKVGPPPSVDSFVKENDVLTVGDESLKVIHTPGHSPGSISLHGKDNVLTGDALFNQSIGRTDTPGGDTETLLKSIKDKLFRLQDNTAVYPGHGPETTIGDEKMANPFVGQYARLY